MDQPPPHGPIAGKAVNAFVSFVLSDLAQRPSIRGRRQELPLQGRQVSYGVKVQLRRGSDRAERIYVSVTALHRGGLTNYQACCEVAGRLESDLGSSSRGRPTAKPRSRQFADKVETVRSIYNRYKSRHPWKEHLPEHDLVYELWCGRFHFFQQWVAAEVFSTMRRGWSGKQLAEELVLSLGEGGLSNYKALKALGEEGLDACLASWPGHAAEPAAIRRKLKRFVTEFFSWKRT